MRSEQLCERVSELSQALQAASGRWGGVEIMAVTKTLDAEAVNPAWEAGIRTIGENRVQELIQKFPALNPNFQVHLIGQLQTNKVKYIMNCVSMVESLDRPQLASALQQHAQRADRIMPVLIQVNIGREPQKAGIDERELPEFVRACAQYPNLSVEGLMAIMPLTPDPEEVRPLFRRMRAWFDRLAAEQIPGVHMRTLSMGMSGDCLVAAQEGATQVRLGTALFGQRQGMK